MISNAGPLSDIRVIELGQLIAGPFCGQLLADFGAEVIKVEPPKTGDPIRRWGLERTGGKPLWWSVIGRNKKSITIDLRVETGQDLARRLIAKADILIENFRPGTLERWNLDYTQLSAVNPKLIMVRVSGFGQTGPYAKRAGFGVIGEAMGGLRHIVGDPTTPPSRMGISIGDSLAGTFAALGAMMALHERSRTGRGQVVDAALYEAVLAMTESLIPDYQQGGFIRERTGAILPGIAPSNVYPSRDGIMILIAANQDSVFCRLAEAMGMPSLASDPLFSTHEARSHSQARLDKLISEWTRLQDAAQLESVLAKHHVPASRVYRAPEMLSDAHFAAREAIVKIEDPTMGEIAMQNVVPRLSLNPGKIRSTGPALGEHNLMTFKGILGLSDTEIDCLADAGVI